MYIAKIGRNSLKEYSILTMMSKEEQQAIKNSFRRTSFGTRCEPTVEPQKITSTMFFSREYSRNMANIFTWTCDNHCIQESASCFPFLIYLLIYLYLQFVTECDISHSFAYWSTYFSSARMLGFINSIQNSLPIDRPLRRSTLETSRLLFSV